MYWLCIIANLLLFLLQLEISLTASSVQGECWQLIGIVCCCFVVFVSVFGDFLHVNKSSSQKKKKKKHLKN